MTYAQEYNFHVRKINACIARRENILAGSQHANNSLGELGKVKRTKAEKRELKRLAKIEKAERRALYKLTSKKERKKLAKKTKYAKRKLAKQLKRGTVSGIIGNLNKRGPQKLPLSPTEELMRQASLAGDFIGMNTIAPFGPQNLHWMNKTTLGKYRFDIQNNAPLYIPWTESDITNFFSGPWFQKNPQTGLAPLIHPRRKRNFDMPGVIKKNINRAQKAARKFPPTDIRHVGMIEPGTYIIQHGLDSTWVKIRAPVMIAVAVVASVYLGPAILQAVQSAYASAAGAITGGGAGAAGGTAAAGTAGGTAAGTAAGVGAKATLASKVFAGAKTLSGYVNNARTVKAVVQGEAPPPPIGVTGDSFGAWAFDVAKDEAMKQYGRKITKDEENAIRREIAQLQSQLAPYVKDIPIEPPASLPPVIREIQTVEVVKAEKNQEMMQLLIPGAMIAGAILLGG